MENKWNYCDVWIYMSSISFRKYMYNFRGNLRSIHAGRSVEGLSLPFKIQRTSNCLSTTKMLNPCPTVSQRVA